MGYYSDVKHTDINTPKELFSVTNRKVPIWHLPESIDCINFDSDGSKWLEESNKNDENEISLFLNSPGGKHVNLEPYCLDEKVTFYNDNSIRIESKTRKYKITENHSNNSDMVTITIKDKSNRLVAEKIYNVEQDDGRKMVHLYGKNGNNKFEVIRVYPFQPSENKATDVVNYAYTSNFEKFIRGGIFEFEYYLLNGQEVKAKQTGSSEYEVTDKDGNKIIFEVK